MSYELDRFIVICLGVLTALFIFAGSLSIASNVLYRSTVLSREIATRRVLGARRSHIVRMFLKESLASVTFGILLGGIAVCVAGVFVERFSWLGLFASAGLIICAGLGAAWIAARHASQTPFSRSGLFRSAPDKRGE